MRNKNGQVIFVVFMVFLVVIVLALTLAYPLLQRTNDVRNQTYDGELVGMDCSNTSISDYTKAACYVSDVTPAYFIGGIIALAGLYIGAKFMLT